MSFLFGNKREQEWVERFKRWAQEENRVFKKYPVDVRELRDEFNQLEWLTQNHREEYAHDLRVYRDMSDSYASICWQGCFYGDFTMATIALKRAKQWADARIWSSDIPVKLGGPTSDGDSEHSGLPYEVCKRCYRAGFCADLAKERHTRN